MDFEKVQLEERLKVVEKKMKFTNLVNTPAMLVIVLGVFSLFSENTQSLYPWLANESLVYKALIIALPWTAICSFKAVKLAIESNKLTKQLS